MKLAWICYDEYNTAVIKFTEPERYLYRVIIPIVYSEIVETIDKDLPQVKYNATFDKV